MYVHFHMQTSYRLVAATVQAVQTEQSAAGGAVQGAAGGAGNKLAANAVEKARVGAVHE